MVAVVLFLYTDWYGVFLNLSFAGHGTGYFLILALLAEVFLDPGFVGSGTGCLLILAVSAVVRGVS